MSTSSTTQLLKSFLLLCLLPTITAAGEVSLQIKEGLQGIADYQAGAADKPAVLVLHGFLQTHNFSTIRLITGELSEAGYSVLSPTLTLNIDQRSKSLTCDAIQNHTVEQATQELAAWVEWLKKKKHKRIILIGHSTGSNHLLTYLHNNPDPVITAFIAASVGPIDSGELRQETLRQQNEANKDLAMGDTSLKRYTLIFCRNNYITAPSHFLSYMQWDRKRILNELKSSPVPTTVVLGEADKWLPADWADSVKNQSIALRRIPEANHYFSGISEFDFQATILSLVEDAAKINGR